WPWCLPSMNRRTPGARSSSTGTDSPVPTSLTAPAPCGTIHGRYCLRQPPGNLRQNGWYTQMTFSKTKLYTWLNAVIEAGWLAALTLAPLFFNVFSSRVFEPDKISLVRSIALMMLLAWLVKLINGGPAWLPGYRAAAQPSPPRSLSSVWQSLRRVPLLIPVALLVLAYLISTAFSVARFVSWWGSYQRLQGTYTFLSYIIIALLTLAHLRTP